MSDSPKISVLMTVFNGQRYLRQAIESVLDQTFGDFEFLIADDGSTDGTCEILADLAAQDGRIRLSRNEQNLGITRSMNRLFGRAAGEYVTRHDSDDRSLPDRFVRQVDFLEAHAEVGVLGSRVELVDADGGALNLGYFRTAFDNESIQQQLLEGNSLCQGSVMMRRNCLERVGYYDVHLEPSEDYDLWLRLAEVTWFACLEAPLYQYRVHLSSISHQRRCDQRLHAAEALEKAVYRRFGTAPIAEQVMPAARFYLQTAMACYRPDSSEVSRLSLNRALNLVPALLEAEAPVNELLAAHLPDDSAEAILSFVEAVFSDLLPPSRAMQRLRLRWLSHLHMREVFADHGRGEASQVLDHLWQGVRYEPRWLLNRGVLAIAARSALRRSPARSPAVPNGKPLR